MRPPPTWTTGREIPKNARMWVPIRTETIRIPKEFTAILRARTARLLVERPSVSVRKIGILSGESTIGKSAPTIRSEARTNSEIAARMGTRGSSNYIRCCGAWKPSCRPLRLRGLREQPQQSAQRGRFLDPLRAPAELVGQLHNALAEGRAGGD